MNSSTNERLSIEKIEYEMWKRANDIISTAGSPIEAYDPLVKMLVGACAVEIHKINQEIENTDQRLLKRLAQLMIPDHHITPVPASAIMTLDPVESEIIITPEIQVSGVREGQEFFFSPSGTYQILNASIEACYLQLNDQLMDLTSRSKFFNKPEPIKQVPLINNDDPSSLNKRQLYLGIRIDPSIKTVQRLVFYIDWKDFPREMSEENCRFMRMAKWYYKEKSLKTIFGLTELYRELENPDVIHHYLDTSYRIEQQVNQLYQNHFISLELTEDIDQYRNDGTPDVIKTYQKELELRSPDELIWIKVQLPVILSEKDLREHLMIAINCIPFMNRKLNSMRHALYGSNMNVVSLQTEDQFLSVHHVMDGKGNTYRNIPFIGSAFQEQGTYYLRSRGVARFDTRHALDILDQLQDLLRDEISAFKGLFPDELSEDIQNLQQILTRMYKNYDKGINKNEPVAYLLINPMKKESSTWEEINVQFWTTQGNDANSIPPGEVKTIYSIGDTPLFHSIVNVTTTAFGRNRMADTEMILEYRHILGARNRIVTKDDIRSICRSFLKSRINAVDIIEGIAIDASPKRGLIRTLDVQITPLEYDDKEKMNWQDLLHELQHLIEDQWVGTWPVRVMLKK
jgi:hypothetical protein